MSVSIWTDDRILRLTVLWLEGRTAAAIASELGGGVSRCAVLGKVYRLGLERSPRPRAPKRPAPRPSVIRRAKPPLRLPRQGVPSDAPAAPATALATILSVRRGDCRWPYGDPGEVGFGLCGRTVARGAFCAAHAEVGYQKRSCTAESLLRMAGVD